MYTPFLQSCFPVGPHFFNDTFHVNELHNAIKYFTLILLAYTLYKYCK
jgi:hypothetical protein